ncbi:MAG: hypothetical protein WCJ49_03855, partial [Deltaproteobacteria bacterium]
TTTGLNNTGLSIIGARAQVYSHGAADNGSVILSGQGGFASNGLVVSDGALVSADYGSVLLTGTSGNGGSGSNYGVWLTGSGTQIKKAWNSLLTITGTSTN